MTLALLVAAVLAQGQAAQIKAAQDAMAELRYPDAKELLTKARRQTGLTKEQLTDVLWMQGLVSASMGQPDAARAFFRMLFAIDPDHKPEKDYPPKIMSPYYEARGWVATNKSLSPEAMPATREGSGRIRRIGVKLAGDPLSIVTSVRFHVGGKTKDVDLGKDLKASMEVDADELSWWAELIGERESKLGRVGDPKAPIVELATPQVDSATAKSDEPPKKRAAEARAPEPRSSDQALDNDMPSLVREPEPPGYRPPRGAAIGLGVVSAGIFAVGAVLGIHSSVIAGSLRAREHDGTGTVTGLTQTQAVMMELQQRREANTANAMFVLGGIALTAAVVLLVWGLIP